MQFWETMQHVCTYVRMYGDRIRISPHLYPWNEPPLPYRACVIAVREKKRIGLRISCGEQGLSLAHSREAATAA